MIPITTDDATPRGDGIITDRGVALLRERIGVPVLEKAPGFESASRDVIVNYARAMGDINPLYRDDEYAAKSRWTGLVGHPTLLRYLGVADPSAMAAEELEKGGRGDPLSGVHGFFAGIEMHWLRPLRVDDRLTIRGGLSDVAVKNSRMGGRAVHEKHDKVFRDSAGDVAGVTRDLFIRIERGHARTNARVENPDIPHHCTPDELAKIDEAYANEYIRGSEPRYWEEVTVGDESAPLVKGPYTVTHFICFMMGAGLSRSRFFYAHSEAYRYRTAHPRAYQLNSLGVPDTMASVHWDREMARRAGVPETYDAGAERIAAMSHAVTNWMGDDAFLRRLLVRINGFLFVGDTMWITLKVVDKRRTRAGGLVQLEVTGRNQRDEVISSGEADVLLPNRDAGPVAVPVREAKPLSIFEGG